MRLSSTFPAPRLLRVLAAACLVIACSEDRERLAGGSVTTNGLTGRVTQGGAPTAGVLVALYPDTHDPFRDPAPALDTTDAQGRYSFTDVDAGIWQVIAYRSEGRSAARVEDIRVPAGLDSALEAPAATLALACSLRVRLPEGGGTPTGYVYLPGTGRGARIDSAAARAGVAVIPGVPAGAYDSLLFRPDAEGSAANLLPGRMTLVPGETRAVNPLAAWKQAVRIRIEPAALAGPAEDLAGFPLLVRLDEAVFDFAAASPGGADLRVTRADSLTPLAFSVAAWDAQARRAALWVRLDSTRSADGGIDLRLFSGPPAALAGSRAALVPSAPVFDTASGFLGVWGFDGTVAGGGPDLGDATENGFHGRASEGLLADSAGAVGPGVAGAGLRLDGRDDHADLGPSSRYLPAAGRSVTLSAWIRLDTVAAGDSIRHRLVSLKTDTAGISALAWGVSSKGTLAHYSRAADSVVPWATALTPGNLHHVALVVAGGSYRGYVDGRLDFAGEASPLGAGGAPSALLGVHLPGNRAWRGLVEELRIERVPRGPLWLRLAHETQRPDGGIVSVTRP